MPVNFDEHHDDDVVCHAFFTEATLQWCILIYLSIYIDTFLVN